MAITKKEIKESIKSAKKGQRFYYEYYDKKEQNSYKVTTKKHGSFGDIEHITDSKGNGYSMCASKKEFIDFLFYVLNENN